MIEYQQKIDCFKSDVLSLCINSNKQFHKFKEYFLFLKERLHYYFGMEDCLLFKVDGKQLKSINNDMDTLFMEAQLTLTTIENEFKNKKIVKLPYHLKELNYFKNHTDMMALQLEKHLVGVVIFKDSSKNTMDEFTEKLINEIAFVFYFLTHSYEVKSNEQKFQKLYNIRIFSRAGAALIYSAAFSTGQLKNPRRGISILLCPEASQTSPTSTSLIVMLLPSPEIFTT